MARAIAKSDLIVFNNVESTNPVFGAIGMPYRNPVAFIPNVTFSTRIEDLVLSNQVRGSMIVVRDLGKGSVKSANVYDDNALDFSHAETADAIRSIPLTDLISTSEKIYEAVDVARASATGAKKTEIAFDDVLTKSQEKISGYLSATATASPDDDAIDKDNIIATIIEQAEYLDYPATILMVSKAVHTMLQKTFTQGYYQANSREDVVRTGIVGKVLGYDVVIDHNADYDFVLYNHNHFPVANVFVYFGVVDARPDFVGSYAQAQLIQGGGGKQIAANRIGEGDGIWGIKYVAATTERTVTFTINNNKWFDADGVMKASDPSSSSYVKITSSVATFTQTIVDGRKVDMSAALATLLSKVTTTEGTFEFVGWYYDNPTDAAAEEKFGGNRPIRKNTTLYARYKKVV